MSFILDALRKSDARRQQSGAPGLNSPEPPRPNRRRRRLLPGLATALVLFAVVAVGVYFVRPGWLPLGSGDSQQASVPGDEPASRQAEPDSGGAGETGATIDAAVDEELLARIEELTEEADTVAQDDQSQDRRRRRVPPSEQEAEAATQQRDVVQEESPQRETAPVPAEDAGEELERRMAEAESRRREEPDQSRDEPEESAQPEPEAAPEPEQDDTETDTRELNEGVSEYVRVWELPLSVRRELPDLSLTIHVYSPDEAERFVLINGERRVAGDEIDGARIVDIRREGALVDFRSHRFLLEPR